MLPVRWYRRTLSRGWVLRLPSSHGCILGWVRETPGGPGWFKYEAYWHPPADDPRPEYRTHPEMLCESRDPKAVRRALLRKVLDHLPALHFDDATYRLAP